MRSLNKLVKLKAVIKKFEKVIIAFSGGVDSTFLAKVTIDLLGAENVLLITASSASFPAYELKEAQKMVEYLSGKSLVIHSEELDIPEFVENSPDRCFHCKSQLFRKLSDIATSEKYDVVFDGSNMDDAEDYRPGRTALKNYQIRSPLMEAGFTKGEIRRLSRDFKLPTADKQSYACLASRFPFGERISLEKLNRVSQAEWRMRELGFQQFRVRSHQDLARIEVDSAELDHAWQCRKELFLACISVGFKFACVDLEGYRLGKMNKTLNSGITESQ